MAKGLSVHIGINTVDPAHYNGWDGLLRACEYDARDMQRIAKARGFKPTILLTRKAKAKAVTDAIAAAAKQLRKGDAFFLSYSGHGGQVPDRNGDEPDQKDETWVLYDRQLVDDELYGLWARFKPGVRVFVLSDSCHSGTAIRAAMVDAVVPMIVENEMVDDRQPRKKNLPRDVEEATYEANQDVYDEIQAKNEPGERAAVGASVLLISGCQDNQYSLDGTRNGLFTQTLLGVWNKGRYRGSHRRFWQAISERMPPTQSPNYFKAGEPNAAFERQTPLTV